MERLLMKMEADPRHIMKHTDYIAAANGYLKASVVDKSLIMLKRAERLANSNDHKLKKHVNHCLLTLYAHAKAEEEVFRIWHFYTRSWDVYNKGYLCMVCALVILDDLQGAEKMIDEWVEALSGNEGRDFRVINTLVRAYGNKDELERAEALVNRVKERTGEEPPRSTWATLAIGYHIHNQMDDSFTMFKKALLTDRRVNFVLNKVHVVRCLDYLKKKGNLEELKEWKILLEKRGYNVENLLYGSTEYGDEKLNFDLQVEEEAVESDNIIFRNAN